MCQGWSRRSIQRESRPPWSVSASPSTPPSPPSPCTAWMSGVARSCTGPGSRSSWARSRPPSWCWKRTAAPITWGRVAQALGHEVRLIPPQYIKPFVERGKNDRNDAEAIREAASRPTVRSVPVKPAESQAEAMDLSARDLLVRQRTRLADAVRGHAAEFGVIAAEGIAQVEPL